MPKKISKEDIKIIKTRFAPSPSGFFHIGSARTALFNYLFAKNHGGKFVLRIEDTNPETSKKEYEEDILSALKWLGLEWDEGPSEKGDRGEEGPYRQSERKKIYRKYLEKLLAEKKAYFCFCSEEELEAQSQYQISIGESPKYSGKCNALTEGEVNDRLAKNEQCIIRLRTPEKKIKVKDLIRGDLEFDTRIIGDFSIAKDLESPLYNFSVTVDDAEMKITHVIRGEDLLSNTPKQILIQDILGLPSVEYAHLPLILAPDRSKLSKRHNAPSVSAFCQDGYLPEAMINFLAFLGWNPGDEREIYSLPSLIKEFSIEKVQKGGAVFNIKRLEFMNGFYIRQRSTEKLTELCVPYLIKSGLIEEVR